MRSDARDERVAIGAHDIRGAVQSHVTCIEVPFVTMKALTNIVHIESTGEIKMSACVPCSM